MQPPPVSGQNGMPMTNARMYQAKVVEEQAPQTQNPSSNSLNPSLQSLI